jgi:hypothetical protein
MSTAIPQKESSLTENITETPEKKSKVKDILVGILILSLLGTWGYIIWDKNNTRELVSQKDNLINTTSTQKDQLQKELEDATLRYENIKSDNAKKDSTISIRDKEIEDKKSRIHTLLSKMNASQNDLKEAKALILSLNSDIEGYKTQIALLESQKVELTKANETVTKERDRIQKGYDSSIEQNKNKDNTIDIASTLHASNFNIAGMSQKNSGKIVETSKAKKVDLLRVSFDLDENMITTSGAKILYIIITDPSGKVITTNQLGESKFQTREGDAKEFTQKMEVNYVQNKRQTVSFDWKSMESFKIGNYKIEVYNNGFKVGEGTRILKKGGINWIG